MGKKYTVTFEEFKEEIELTDKQYGQEEDLYFLVNKIIRSTLPDNMTVRDVHRLQKPPESEEFQGRKHFIAYGQVPEFVILDKEFKQSEKKQNNLVYGCVEVKQFKKNRDFRKIEKKLNNYKKNNKKVYIYIQSENIYEKGKRIKDPEIRELLKEIIYFKKVIFTNGKKWYYIKATKLTTYIKLNGVPKKSVSFKDIEITELYDYSKTGEDEFNEFMENLKRINWN